MKKNLILPLLCLGLSHPITGKHTLRPTSVIQTVAQDRSCGASVRLMGDTFVLNLSADRARVNYSDWKIDEWLVLDDGLTHLRLTHGSPESYTKYTIDLMFSPNGIEGVFVLSGRTEDRSPCVDAVRLAGR